MERSMAETNRQDVISDLTKYYCQKRCKLAEYFCQSCMIDALIKLADKWHSNAVVTAEAEDF